MSLPRGGFKCIWYPSVSCCTGALLNLYKCLNYSVKGPIMLNFRSILLFCASSAGPSPKAQSLWLVSTHKSEPAECFATTTVQEASLLAVTKRILDGSFKGKLSHPSTVTYFIMNFLQYGTLKIINVALKPNEAITDLIIGFMCWTSCCCSYSSVL